METNNKNEQNEALDRRNFIAKTILAGAGMAAITAWPGEGDAQTIRQGKTLPEQPTRDSASSER